MKTFILCHAHPAAGTWDNVLMAGKGLPGCELTGDEMPEAVAHRRLGELGVVASLPDICIVGSLNFGQQSTILLLNCPFTECDSPEVVPFRQFMETQEIVIGVRIAIALLRAGCKGFSVSNIGPFVNLNMEGRQ